MSYRVFYHQTSSLTVGLWRPQIVNSTSKVVLLLGRSPANWFGTNPSGQLREFVQNDYWVVTLNTPNWGNQTDMNNIDTILAWMESQWGLDASRLYIVAHGSGCVPALNWGMRHDEQVASMVLQAPIIDLAERYARGQDVASLNAAFGGNSTTFNAAMPTWNPAHLHRKVMIKDLLAGRLKIYYSTSDAVTPPSVTTTFASEVTAAIETMSNTDPTLISPAPVIASAIALDTAWTQQASHVEQRRWTNLIYHPTLNYRGGDMADSVELPDGRVIWIGSDIFAGAVDANDNTLQAVLPFRNAIFIQDVSGNFVDRVFESGSGGVAFSPDYNVFASSWIYWPIACMEEDDVLYVGCWLVAPSGPYGELMDSHIVALDTTNFDVISRTPFNITTDKFFIDGFLTDGAYTYIYGEQFVPRYGNFTPSYGTPAADPQGVTYKHVIRVPVGSVTNTALYEWWTGSGWSANEADAMPMVDSNDDPLQGDSAVHKIGPGDYVFAGRTLREANLRVYRGSTPYGPWTLNTTIPTPSVSDLRYGGVAIGQIGKFVPHVATPVGTIQYSICPNLLAATDPVTNMAAETFRTRFVTVPID